MAAACPPKNCEKMKAAPVRDSGRRNASKVCPWSMITAASPRSQSRNTIRWVVVECMSISAGGLTCNKLKMRRNLKRLLPLHLNNKLTVGGWLKSTAHGGFRPRIGGGEPRFFSVLGGQIF